MAQNEGVSLNPFDLLLSLCLCSRTVPDIQKCCAAESRRLFTESRRDQEEGGELDSQEEVSPEEIKSREVVLGV